MTMKENYYAEIEQIALVHNIKVINSENRVPVEWNDKGLFSKYYVDAYKKLKEMSGDEKIGQLLLVRVQKQIK